MDFNKKGAIISADKKYRYSLYRIWNEKKPKVLFIMLNPSTADANVDDPTIRRCIGFAKRWGYGGIYVGNLFPYRSTLPKELLNVDMPEGYCNELQLKHMAERSDIVVCAWGNGPIVDKLMKNNPEYLPLIEIKKQLYCLGLSDNGVPRHPLYLKKEAIPKRFKFKKK